MRNTAGALLLPFAFATATAFAQVENFAPVANLEENTSGILLRADVSHTDNATRTADATAQEDTLGAVGVVGKYQRNGTKLDVTFDGNLDWVTYLDNSYGSQVFGYAEGSALWGTTADFFQFLVQDNYGQARTDAFAAPTPDTLESINNLTAGPAFNFHFGPKTLMTVFGLYRNTDYEKSDFDSEGVQGGVSLARATSESGRISLNGVVDQVNFEDQTFATDYDTRQAYLRYQNSGARTAITADAGYNEIEQAGRTNGGALVRLGLQRRISAASFLQFDVAQGYTANANTAGQAPIAGANPNTPDALAIADPMEGRSAQLAWRTVLPRTSFHVSAYWRDEQYQNLTQFDRSIRGVEATVTRRLRSTLTLLLQGTLEKEEYDNLDANNDTTTLVAELNNSFGRRIALALRYERYRRSGSSAIQEYTENRIGLRLTYLLAGQR